jgi:hypothetical protein
MQTILNLLKKAGGWHPGLYLKIDNPPHMELIIEAMDESGPLRSRITYRDETSGKTESIETHSVFV